MGLEEIPKSTPKDPTRDETRHYNRSWGGKSRAERGGDRRSSGTLGASTS